MRSQPTSVPYTDSWIPNGSVFAAAETNGVLYIGGSFDQIGPLTGGFVAVDPLSAAVVPPFPLVTGAVTCTISDGLGELYIGGTFNGVGGFPVNNLARFGPNLAMDTNFVFNVDGAVSALALYGNQLFVGGAFSKVNDQSLSFLAAIDTATHELLSFPIAVDGEVLALAVVGDELYLGGGFTHVGGLTRNHLAAVDLTTGQVSSWSPLLDSMFGRGVTSILPADGRCMLLETSPRSMACPGSRWRLSTQRVICYCLGTPEFPLHTRTLASMQSQYRATRCSLVETSRTWEVSLSHMIGAVDKTSGNALSWNPGIPANAVNALAISGEPYMRVGTLRELEPTDRLD